MKTTLLHRIATCVLLLGLALPAFAQAQDAPPPIGVQLYTLRSIDSLEEQLKTAHDAGIRAVETVGTHNVSATDFKQLLDKYSIQVTSMHMLLSNLRNDLDNLVAFNKTIGNSVLVIAYLMENERPGDAAGWTALGQQLDQIAGKLEAEGMTLAYHNHDFEFANVDGTTALELMFEAAPKLKAELDVAWVNRAGYDPAAVLGQFAGRVFAIHAKDNAPEGQAKEEGGFAAVGQGVLDWNAILPAAKAAGVKWYIIEHDLPRDPAAVIKAGATYLNQHLSH